MAPSSPILGLKCGTRKIRNEFKAAIETGNYGETGEAHLIMFRIFSTGVSNEFETELLQGATVQLCKTEEEMQEAKLVQEHRQASRRFTAWRARYAEAYTRFMTMPREADFSASEINSESTEHEDSSSNPHSSQEHQT